MPITIDYTPIGALTDLAIASGKAKGTLQQRELDQRLRLAAYQTASQVAQERMRQDAAMQRLRASAQYQAAIVGMKADIDMQLELQEYQRQKQKLQGLLTQIKESDQFSEREKQELITQATAKYAGVGTGISPTMLRPTSTAYQNFIAKSQAKMGMIKYLEEAVANDIMSPDDAGRLAKAYGLTGTDLFQRTEEKISTQLAKEQARLKQIADYVDKKFVNVGPRGPDWMWRKSIREKPRIMIKTKQGKPGRKATETEKAEYEVLMKEKDVRLMNVQQLTRQLQFEGSEEVQQLLKEAPPNKRQAIRVALARGWTVQQVREQLMKEEGR